MITERDPRDPRLVRLEQRLALDDLDLIKEARSQGWELLTQGQGFYWQNGPTKSVAIFTDTALIDYIRDKLNGAGGPEKATEPARPTQGEVVERLLSSGRPERISAHDIDLKNSLIEWLRAEGVAFERDVDCIVRTAEVITEDAVYDFKCGLAPENLAGVIENLVSCRKTLVDDPEGMVNQGAAAVIVTCCAEDLEETRERAAGLEVEVKTLDEIKSPSPPEFVEALLSSLNEIESLTDLSRFIEKYRLQDVLGDRRFTPSQQRKLEAALDEAGERVMPGLSTEADPVDGLRDDAVSSSFTAGEVAKSLANGQLFPPDEAAAGIIKQQMLPSKMSTHPSLMLRAEGLNKEHVEELRAVLASGGRFRDPQEIFFDGEHYWVAEGNHRRDAALPTDTPLDINLHYGTLRDAVRFALRANADHGLKLSRDDKRMKAVTVLADPEWYKESDTVLATYARGITQQFISSVRRDLKLIIPSFNTEVFNLPEAEAEEADTQLADSLKVPPGLVRVLRRIPRDEFDTLSQNVLGDDGRRRGSDGVTRTVPAKEQGEPEAPLFDGAEEMPVQTTQNILAEDAPPPIQVTDRRPVHLDDESSDATPETEQAAVVSAAEAPAASADSEDIQPLTNLKKGHKIAVCDTCGKGFPDVQIKEDEGFTCSACHGDERTAVREEAQETAGARQQSPALTVADLRDALRQGPLSRLQLEDLGFESPLINSAVASGDVAQPEIGKFSLPADPPPVQAGGEKKVSIQELLKGRPLTLSFVFLPTLQGKVSVSVNAGGKPETALRGLLDEAAARNFSEPVQELIVAALKKAAPAKSGSKAGQTKGTAKAAAKKSSKKAATKTAAKKSSSKSKSKSARA
ncbi:MAG TPA: hypothetical protein VF723_11420 [Pyrinomonadaceae bacterium]|jgi:hypothetical protein